MKSEAKKAGGHYVLEVVKAMIIAIIVSLVLILLAAFIIKIFNIATGAIPIINQVIKGISILVGCLIALRLPHNGWVRGIVVGLLYIAISFVIFSLLDGHFDWGLHILNDVALGSVTGMLSGIIAANLKK